MPIPSDGTTFSHNIKEDGNAPYEWGTPTLDHSVPEDVNTQIQCPSFVSPKTFQSDKSAKNI
jgi:hypothetical protein